MNARRRFWAVSLGALAFAPLCVSLWVALYSRPIYDDFDHIAAGKELGAWAGMLHWRRHWNGSYSDYFSFGALAPLDEMAPAAMALLSICLWLAGAAALAGQLLKRAGCPMSRATRFAFAALALAATISALETESFYWYAANARYAFPAALLTIALAICASSWPAKPRAAAVATICFVSAGFSAMFGLFQLACLGLILLGARWLRDGGLHPALRLSLGAGLATTLLSLLVQFSAPGARIRMEAIPSLAYNYPARSAEALLLGSLHSLLEFLGDPWLFNGFALLFCAGLLYASACGPAPSHHAPFLRGGTLWLGFIAQCLCAPFLWAHQSESPQFFGRFSLGYFLAVALNIVSIIFWACLLQGRRRVNQFMTRRPAAEAAVAAAALGLMLGLFAMTQLRSVHFRASSYLFLSCVCALVVLTGSRRAGHGAGMGWLATCCGGGAIALASVLIAPNIYAQGYAVERALIPVAFVLIASGGLWGLALGGSLRPVAGRPARWLRSAILLTALVIGASQAIHQARVLPAMSEFARAWDARKSQILAAQARGDARLETPRFRFRLASPLSWGETVENKGERDYYGATAFTCSRDACRVVFEQAD